MSLIDARQQRSDAAPAVPTVAAKDAAGTTMFPALTERALWYSMDRPRPTYRGKLHLCCALTSPVWVSYQLSLCQTSYDALAAFLALFAALFLFSASASFHLGKWTPAQERWAMKLDYVGIFLQVAFSFAPFYVLLLPQAASRLVLLLLAATVLAGVWLTLAEAPLGRHALVWVYISQAVVQLVPLGSRLLSNRSIFEQMLPSEGLLFAGMAASYLVGSQCYAHAWPRLWPDTFGFHELWHLFVAAGSLLSYASNCSVLRRCSAERLCH